MNPVETAPVVAPPQRSAVMATVREALQLVRSHPRQIILPLLAIEAPVAFVSALVTVAGYLLIFDQRTILTSDMLFGGENNGPLLLFLILAAIEGLFSTVARGGAIVAIAAAAAGKPKTLTEALDPAFTRMGGLLVLVLLLGFIAVATALSLIFILVLPYLVVRASLSFEAFMLEGRSPVSAIGRSWGLTQGNVLRLAGTLLVSAAIVVPPLLLLSNAALLIPTSGASAIVLLAAFNFAQSLLTLPFVAFITSVTTLFYLASRRYEDAARAV